MNVNISSLPHSALRAPMVSRGFSITLGVSVGLHVALLVGYAIYEARKLSVLDIPDEPIRASLVRLGKPRDPKMLPRLTNAPKPSGPKDDRVAVPTQEAKADAARQDRLQSALEKIHGHTDREEAKDEAVQRIADRVGKQTEPEEGQEDGTPEGDSPTPVQVNAYLAALKMAVKRHYLVPTVIQPGECLRLVATAMVRMSADGAVQEVRVHQGSGNDLFDAAVVQAIKTASPFPKPPDNMHALVTHGFGFKFRCTD